MIRACGGDPPSLTSQHIGTWIEEVPVILCRGPKFIPTDEENSVARSTFTRRTAIGAVSLLAGITLAACGGVQGAGGGEEANLQFAAFLGPTTPQGTAFNEVWEKLSADDNGINVEPFWEGSLLKADEMVPGTAQGRADIGYTTAQYNPGDIPLTQAATVPFQVEDWIAATDAYNELYKTNDAFRKEWEDLGLHVLAFAGVPNSIMATKDPVPDFESLRGLQIRSSGYTSNALELAGASPVSLAAGEIYESIQRGLVSGYTTMILDTVPSLSLEEVAPWVMDTGIGQYTMNIVFINLDTWNSLSDGQKAALEDAIEEFKARYPEIVAEKEDLACEGLKENGGGVIIWSEEDKQQWRDLVGTTGVDAFVQQATASGAEDAAGFLQSYIDYVKANPSGAESGMERCANS